MNQPFTVPLFLPRVASDQSQPSGWRTTSARRPWPVLRRRPSAVPVASRAEQVSTPPSAAGPAAPAAPAAPADGPD